MGITNTIKSIGMNKIPTFRSDNISFKPSKIDIEYDLWNEKLYKFEVEMFIDSYLGNEAINNTFKNLDIPQIQIKVVLEPKEKVLKAIQKVIKTEKNINNIWKIKTKNGKELFLDLNTYNLKKIIHIEEQMIEVGD